ncbi:hypothetical protein [Roseomonas sp. 18066]|uniref:hypothetical protein n=1 Tax=Roseomonas sp. 18066 TaxID=2681412 RepID=UPI0013583D87|nr:hypothetical protein [Roseomonas sp. 18066]
MDLTGSDDPLLAPPPADADPAPPPEAAADWLDAQLRATFEADRAEPLPPRLLALLRPAPSPEDAPR